MVSDGFVQRPPLRAVYYVLAAKWCVAIALLFALTLPITTCHSRGKLQEHHLTIGFENLGTVLSFIWPLFVLVPRTFWRKPRFAYPLPIAECICALAALASVIFYVVAIGLISFGGVSPGRGYDLAFASLLGYLGLSLVDFAVLFANRRRRPAQP